jgi:hypothetical protein
MKFTLRDLFWLVLVCALAVGWWVDHARLVAIILKLDPWFFGPFIPPGLS